MIVDNYGKMKFVRHNFTPIKNKLLNKHSDAETRFVEMLTLAGIYFIREKGNYKYNTRWCYYDFYLPFYRIYIEIDGSSHNNDEQKIIDADKNRLIKNKQMFMARFSNEEVMSMDEITIGAIIDRVVLSLKTKRHPHRDYRKRYFDNLERNYLQSVNDMRNSANFLIDESKKVYLYDHYIGEYFCFKNIFEAKLNTELSINAIYRLLNDFDYKKSSNRRFVFGWTLEECENNVAKVFY